MASNRPYHDEDWLRHKYWGEGLTQSEIAAEQGVRQATISTWLKNHGIERRSHGGYPADAPWKDGETMQELLDELGTSKAIAERLGISEAAVSRWMARHNIETKDTRFKKA